MTTPLRVLMVEDRPADALLMAHELQRAGFQPDWTRVDTEADFLAQLGQPYDVFLVDGVMPEMDARRALQLVHERGVEVPIIIVTGTLDEETAVEFMRQGAADYLLKDRLARLGQAVKQALDKQRLRGERKQAEEALRMSERHYRLLFDFNPQPLWVYDTATLRFLAVNEAAISHYGYSRAEFLAMTIKDIRPAEELAALAANLASLPPASERSGVWRHKKKDGTVIDVEITSHAIAFADRGARIVLAKDVTEQKRLEEQLRQAQKLEAIGRLAGGVAHDFNNLLTVINGYSEVLLSGLCPDDPNTLIREISRAGEKATALTRQLLAFSRKQVLEPVVLDLNALVVETEKMLRRLIGEDIRLVTPLDPTLGRIKADPSQVDQVIWNLAVNARDAMPGGGELTIRTRNLDVSPDDAALRPSLPPGSYVVLSVSDTGIGMDQATQARIFEPFFTTKELGKGTGLGLATVYGIVKQSEGHIEVDSAPGRGATFHIYLPRLADTRAHAAAVGPAFAAPGGRETLLLVEDEQAVRAFTRLALQSSGYTVLEAGDGEEALQACAAHAGPIHLLVTDLVMPRMGGRQLADRLASVRPDTKVLFLSGYTDDTIIQHGAFHRDVGFLQKPFTPTALAKKVRQVLDQS